MSVLWPSPLFGAQSPHSSNLFPTALPVLDAWPRTLPLFTGAKTFHGVVTENGTAKHGTLWGSVNWTFYDRILIEPVLIDLGNLISPRTRTITVWNGFFTDKLISALNRIDDPGITLTEPVSLPYDLKPLQELVYTATIDTVGPPVIYQSYTWVIDDVSYTSEIIGRRLIVFPFPPNFREDVTETLEWKTDVMRAYSGIEQRRALRIKPRRGFEYTFSLFNRDLQRLQNTLFGWQGRSFGMPVWVDKRRTTQDHLEGDTTIYLDTTYCSFTSGGLAILYASVTSFEVVNIDVVSDTSLVLTRHLENDWPIGTTVFPLLLAHLPKSVPSNRVTDTVIEGVATFLGDPVSTDPYMPVEEPAVIYDGLEVVTRQPDWSSPIDTTFDMEFSDVDMQVGAIAYLSSETFARSTRRYRWMLTSKQEVVAFRSFLERRRGQVKTCWIPTWTDDFTVLTDTGASETLVKVADNGFRTLVGVDYNNDTLMFRLKDGTVYYRRIVGVELADDEVNTFLEIDTPFGVLVTADSVKAVHSMQRCRLATDKVDLVWKTDSTVTVDTTFTTVPP